MKKKILLVLILAMLVTGCGKIPKLANGEETLVELKDGTKYSVDEIWNELKNSYALTTILKKVDAKILEDLYESNKEDVDNYINTAEVFMRANYESEEAMLNTLSQNGYASLDAYLEEIKVNYLTNLATEEYAKSLVSDKEINEYYKKEIVGDIEVVHILVKPNGTSTEENNKAKEKAQNIIKDINADIKSGVKAEEAFKKYADNTDVTYEELGRVTKGDNVSEFDDSAFKLKKGAYTSNPIKTSYGYHVILKTNEFDKLELDEVKNDIIKTLADEKMDDDNTISAQAMNKLRKDNDFKLYDDELERSYDKYMNYLLNLK